MDGQLYVLGAKFMAYLLRTTKTDWQKATSRQLKTLITSIINYHIVHIRIYAAWTAYSTDVRSHCMSVIRLEKQIKGKTKSSGFFIIYYNMCIYYSFRTSLMHTHSHKYTITCDEIEEFSVDSLNNKRGTYNVQRQHQHSSQYIHGEKKKTTRSQACDSRRRLYIYTHGRKTLNIYINKYAVAGAIYWCCCCFLL